MRNKKKIILNLMKNISQPSSNICQPFLMNINSQCYMWFIYINVIFHFKTLSLRIDKLLTWYKKSKNINLS